jgi:hypothetical protein
MISRALAKTRLRKRWKEQVDRYPTMANDIPLDTYIAANWRRVAENDFLADYDHLPNWRPKGA